jgi:hypothetical protein
MWAVRVPVMGGVGCWVMEESCPVEREIWRIVMDWLSVQIMKIREGWDGLVVIVGQMSWERSVVIVRLE